MDRREFIALFGGAAVTWPLETIAQQSPRVRQVGVLMAVAADQEGQSRVAAFRKALQQIGWSEGRDLRIIDRWTAGEAGLRHKYAAELVGLAPDVILVNGLLPLKALLEQTRSIPVVFVQVSDPVGSGFVPNMARPGGHITGFTHFESPVAGKWLELLKELAPSVRRVAVMCAPQDPAFPGYLRAMEAVAPLHGVQVIPSGVSDERDVERQLNELTREEWRYCRATFAVNHGTTQAHNCRCSAPSPASDISVALLRQRWGSRLLRDRQCRSLPSSRGIR
jgi:putative tryptophan/tyrosine transport system substrate-binding protein